jgi:hypothetical protein
MTSGKATRRISISFDSYLFLLFPTHVFGESGDLHYWLSYTAYLLDVSWPPVQSGLYHVAMTYFINIRHQVLSVNVTGGRMAVEPPAGHRSGANVFAQSTRHR